MTQADPYFLGHRQAEQARLQVQGRELASEANWLFDQLDLPLGARVIELGCGPRGCLDLLSERVGPQGTVVGLEQHLEDPNTLVTSRLYIQVWAASLLANPGAEGVRA